MFPKKSPLALNLKQTYIESNIAYNNIIAEMSEETSHIFMNLWFISYWDEVNLLKHFSLITRLKIPYPFPNISSDSLQRTF